MKGRRVPWPADRIPVEQEKFMDRDGDYSGPWPKSKEGLWLLRASNGDWASGSSSSHTIEEHEDGTVSFTPSIKFNTGQRWHGYLKRGEWTSC